MSTVTTGAEQRVVLDRISWQTYLAILHDTDNRRSRIAYDQGVIEIMSPSMLHETVKRLIGRMIEVFSEERSIEIVSSSSTTFKRADVESGFEADECYYVANAATVLGKEEIDLTVDPPPDLVLEVDISRSSLNKFGIYRALRVPEVWRSDGRTVQVDLLRNDEYLAVGESAAFPQLPIDLLEQLLQRRGQVGETQLVRRFRESLRQ